MLLLITMAAGFVGLIILATQRHAKGINENFCNGVRARVFAGNKDVQAVAGATAMAAI